MNILVVGAGGREHALCWAIAASPLTERLYCAPGSDAISALAECVAIDVSDCAALVEFAERTGIDLVVVGPELPLSLGLADQLAKAGIRCFGPEKSAAQLETSKGFAKDFAARHDIPTAKYVLAPDREAALDILQQWGAPIVIKADGLAAGKGVVVAETMEEATTAIDRLSKIGGAGLGGGLVLEEKMVGEELSFFALSDGRHILPLASAQDHKRAFEGEKGPNTGGMGAYSPAPVATEWLEAQIMDEIARPTIAGMAEEGIPYKGVLFIGLMITDEGPKLIEFNVRFGDPECQTILPRLESDLVPALLAACDGGLDAFDLRWRPESSLAVVLAAKGYPGTIARPQAPIPGLDKFPPLTLENSDQAALLFHAGTKREPDTDSWQANGGRVLTSVGLGEDLLSAKKQAYAVVEDIGWADGFYRQDIGWRALNRF